MTRKKVKLEFITNESARKSTFKKRKKGLLKKIEELTTLCGVDACAIIYSPYDEHGEVWPSPSGARRVVARFMGFSPEAQGKKMLDQESYLKHRVAKTSLQLEKLRNEKREKEITELMYDCITGVTTIDGLALKDVKDLCLVTDKALDMIAQRIEYLEKQG